MHSVLVACQSPALFILVNGGIREARERLVAWKETDTSVFLCFSQFAYTGDYRIANGHLDEQGEAEQANFITAKDHWCTDY